jgi:predicted  nucleic acid-binding Zn-ribbon protein
MDKPEQQLANLITLVNDLDRRLKVLENRYFGLRKRTETTDQNMVDVEKAMNEDVRVFNGDVMELKTELHDLKEKMELFAAEFASVADKYELKTIETYLSLWQPLDFVRKDELRAALNQLRMRLEAKQT